MGLLNLLPEALKKRLFPEAIGGSVAQAQLTWLQAYDQMCTKYARYQQYYSGAILEKLADPKRPKEGLYYPLRLNLCRMWAHMMASHLWGEWDRSVVTFTVERAKTSTGSVSREEEARCRAMESAIRRLWVDQGNDARADTAGIDLMVYGGIVPKVYFDVVERKVKTDWVPVDFFCPRWHPMDVTKLLETYIRFDMSRGDAHDIFGVDTTDMPEIVSYTERWTPTTCVIMVHDREIKESYRNTEGFIPHIYIPRVRSSGDNYGYYGLSLLADTMSIQDEVNLRAADIGDGVAYSSHPIRWVVNYTGKQDLEVSADSLWDLGLGMGGREPKAGVLNVQTNYDESMRYVDVVQGFGRQSSSLPPIAFGEDEGSQRSSLTLLVRYDPLIKETRRQRLHVGGGLREWARLSLILEARHGNVRFTEQDLTGHTINVNFAPVLPRSVEDAVNMWNVRIQGGFGIPEEAYRDLGDPEPEMAATRALEYAEQIARAKSITRGVWNGRSEDDGSSAGDRGVAEGSGQADEGNAG